MPLDATLFHCIVYSIVWSVFNATFSNRIECSLHLVFHSSSFSTSNGALIAIVAFEIIDKVPAVRWTMSPIISVISSGQQ